MPRTRHGEELKVQTTLTIDPKVLTQSKNLAWEKKTTLSLQIENLLKEWVDKSKNYN